MYEDNAVERDWFCLQPQMNEITRVAPAQDSPTKLILAVSYEFSSAIANNARDQAACSGFSTRTFTFDRSAGGLTLVGMSGEQRAS